MLKNVNNYFNLHDIMGSLSKMMIGLSSDNVIIRKIINTVILHNSSKIGGYVKQAKPDTKCNHEF